MASVDGGAWIDRSKLCTSDAIRPSARIRSQTYCTDPTIVRGRDGSGQKLFGGRLEEREQQAAYSARGRVGAECSFGSGTCLVGGSRDHRDPMTSDKWATG
jgi:hypothetical protein